MVATGKVYRIFDIRVDSTLSLPELPDTGQNAAALYFMAGSRSLYGRNKPDWFHHWYSSANKICASCARTDNGYLLRYHNLADFLISPQNAADTVSVVGHPAPGTPHNSLRHLLLDSVIPRILGQQGRLVLHASAVVLPDGAGVAFLGSSGWGKSTIASCFSCNGARLLTDDCLLVDMRDKDIVAIPSYVGIRLFSDSADELFADQSNFSKVAHYSDKKKLILRQQNDAASEAKLQAIFLLNDPAEEAAVDEISIEPVKGADSVMTIIKRVFLLDVHDMKTIADLFSNAGQLTASGLPVYSLSFPRKYDKLADLRAAVLSAVAGKNML